MPDNKNILIVDDDPRIVRTLSRHLDSEGYTTTSAMTCAQASEKLDAGGVDLMLLDVMLPDGDGKSFLMDIRKNYDLPIIMVTGRGEQVDKIVGLEMGADDYITKPYDERELTARIKAIFRRADKPTRSAAEGASPAEHKVFEFDTWSFNPNTHEIHTADNDTLTLTSHESRLLECLIAHTPRTVSRDQILDEVSGRQSNPYDRSVDVLIAKIRKKIEPNPEKPHFIITVRGAGYRFVGRPSAV